MVTILTSIEKAQKLKDQEDGHDVDVQLRDDFQLSPAELSVFRSWLISRLVFLGLCVGFLVFDGAAV